MDNTIEEMSDIHHYLHRLWGKAVGSWTYDKNEWIKLQQCIYDLESEIASYEIGQSEYETKQD